MKKYLFKKIYENSEGEMRAKDEPILFLSSPSLQLSSQTLHPRLLQSRAQGFYLGTGYLCFLFHPQYLIAKAKLWASVSKKWRFSSSTQFLFME